MAKLQRLLALAAVFAGVFDTVLATPTPNTALLQDRANSPTNCTNPAKRRAWHTLPPKDRKAYLKAQRCVMSKPRKIALPGARTQFDELVSIHQLQGLTIHSTGTFLPWHRWYLDLHEKLLKECGYQGALPYWDEYHESSLPAIQQASVFDPSPVYGFGTEGTTAPAYCLTDGPFTNYVLAIGPAWNITDGCIGRSHFPGNALRTIDFFGLPGQENVTAQTEYCLTLTDFVEAATCIYLTPHVAGHVAMGAVRGDALTSPSEPLFYLHHAYIDKLWWQWQQADPANRTYAIGGNNKQDPAIGFIELPGGQQEEWNGPFFQGTTPTAEQIALSPAGDEGDNGDTVTLDHVFTSYGNIPDVTARSVMDTEGGYLCYEYV